MAFAAALGAGPLGKGYVDIGGGGAVRTLAHKGSVAVGPFTVGMDFTEMSSVAGGATLALPLGQWAGFRLFGGGNQASQNDTQTEPVTASRLSYDTYTEGWNAGGGLELYPWAWSHRYDDATDGNPDGKLYWPIPGIGFTWSKASVKYTRKNAEGAFSGFVQPYDAYLAAWSGRLTLTLPLHRMLSAGAAYGKGLHQWTEQNGRATEMDAPNENVSAYLTGWLPLFSDGNTDPDDYFPLLGWPGDLRVSVGFARSYSLSAGRESGREYGAEAVGVIYPWLAARISYTYLDVLRRYYDNVKGFETQTGNTDEQSVVGSIRINFGGLPWF